jgi:hypothetical protein
MNKKEFLETKRKVENELINIHEKYKVVIIPHDGKLAIEDIPGNRVKIFDDDNNIYHRNLKKCKWDKL